MLQLYESRYESFITLFCLGTKTFNFWWSLNTKYGAESDSRPCLRNTFALSQSKCLHSPPTSLCYAASIMHRSLPAFSGERIKDAFFGPCSKMSRRCAVCYIHLIARLIVRLSFSFLVATFQQDYLQSKKFMGFIFGRYFKSHATYLHKIMSIRQNMANFSNLWEGLGLLEVQPLAYPRACWTYFWW